MREERWSMDQIRKIALKPNHISKQQPDKLVEPIVIAEYRDKHYVIDGGNRISLWKRSDDTDHWVAIIETGS